MNKTDQALAAIFRHCDEVAEGKRQPRGEREGRRVALAWLGVKENEPVQPRKAGEKTTPEKVTDK